MSKALLLIDHGSKKDEANKQLFEVAKLVTEINSELIVECAHMELASPSITEGFAACVERGATEVIAHPYMLAPGRHATEDIPRMVKVAAEPYPEVKFLVTAPLGLHMKLAEIVLERAGLL